MNCSLPGHPASTNFIHTEGKDINSGGEIVGNAARLSGSPTSGGAAMIWNDGVAYDLNSLAVGATGWVRQSAGGINEHGDRAGYGSFAG